MSPSQINSQELLCNKLCPVKRPPWSNRPPWSVVSAKNTLIMLTPRRAEGREFNPRPGHYSRMSFSPDQVTGTVFPHLNMPFLPNSKFIENIVLVGKQKLLSSTHTRGSQPR